MQTLPALSASAHYEALAQQVWAALAAGDPAIRGLYRQVHPRFRRTDVPWLTADGGEVDAVEPLDEVRLAVARGHQFLDWSALVTHAAAASDPDSPVHRFEAAVEAVIDGDEAALRRALLHDPALVHARSTRVNCFDPPIHRATLLHYVAANGVENHRQRVPVNAPAIATILLQAGAEADALADLYGDRYTTLALLVSSSGPAGAGVTVPLIETLVAFGASVDGTGESEGRSPLRTALVFEQADAAHALVRLGAAVADLPCAAGLGRLDDVLRLLPTASATDRHGALVLAAQYGHRDVVTALLDAGEDPNRHNPPRFHAHTTPLHQAALRGDVPMVELLIARGARTDLKDRVWNSTPAGWAEHGGHTSLAERLRRR